LILANEEVGEDQLMFLLALCEQTGRDIASRMRSLAND